MEIRLQLQLEYKPAHIYGISPMRLELSNLLETFATHITEQSQLGARS